MAWVPLEEKKAVKRVKKYLQTFTSNVIDFRVLLLVCGRVYKENGCSFKAENIPASTVRIYIRTLSSGVC